MTVCDIIRICDGHCNGFKIHFLKKGDMITLINSGSYFFDEFIFDNSDKYLLINEIPLFSEEVIDWEYVQTKNERLLRVWL